MTTSRDADHGSDKVPTSHAEARPEGLDAAVEEEGQDQEISYADLARREQSQSALGLPVPNPPHLPMAQLNEEVFERVVAEVVAQRATYNVLFYGRRGQTQYGLDVVAYTPDRGTVLYQVKRYQKMTAAKLRKAVVEYAGRPRPVGHDLPARRFNPSVFVVVTSATIEDTAVNDELEDLRREYAGDLEIELWGAAQLNPFLRARSAFVTAVFGAAWATAFCGTAASPTSPGDPDPQGLIDGPTRALRLESRVTDAEAMTKTDPAAAAELYASVAAELDAASFPGQAAQMRSHQAGAARAAGDLPTSFRLRVQALLAQLTRGDAVHLFERDSLREDAEALGDVCQAKWTLLAAAARWQDSGADLPAVTAAATRLAASGDPDAATLCCLTLEHALVDGLFDFTPPRSLSVDLDETSPTHLMSLRVAAEAVQTNDDVLTARLRCALADASLQVTSTLTDVDAAYRDLLDDASDELLTPANGLVFARAAYAFATHSGLERAFKLWHRAALHHSRVGYYGDARHALRSQESAYSDAGQWLLRDLQALVQSMPNRRQLLEAHYDPALSAFEEAQNEKWPSAFAASRRWLREARLSGALLDEQLAWRQYGRVLRAADNPAAAVECFARSGDLKDAVATARPLPERTAIWALTQSQQRRHRAVAIAVTSAQNRLVPDDEVPPLADALLTFATGMWEVPNANPNPQREALKALDSLGERIPAAAIDGILTLVEPALSHPTSVSGEVAHLLLNAFYAVPSRQDDLGAALMRMARLSNATDDLWGMVRSIATAADRAPLLEMITMLANQGDESAIATLTAWSHDHPGAQLTARRAAAVLLRRSVGHDRTSFRVSTQERAVAKAILALLDAAEQEEIGAEQLTPEHCSPVGAVILEQVSDEETGEEVIGLGLDEASHTAAGDRHELLVAVAAKLVDLTNDGKDSAESRVSSLQALRLLIPRLPADVAASYAHALMDLHDDPRFSLHDKWSMGSNNKLSRFRMGTDADLLPAYLLLAAAEAFQRAGEAGHPLKDDADFAAGIISRALPLLREEERYARPGAFVVAAIASTAPGFAQHTHGLLMHPLPIVRAVGAQKALLHKRLVTELASDPAPLVRRSLATRHEELPEDVVEQLSNDPDAAVRRTARALPGA
ncbi:hypothetical protein [Kineococcus gypseus]|uniref:hypothetical protein n=1 Tax=Kineococcus gypseus TaxID=1637102 RepID=UPI003D7E17DB